MPQQIANEDMICLTGGGRTTVLRQGEVIIRDTGPWTSTVHALLRHLQQVGFTGAPRVVGSGFDAQGREILTYIAGEFRQPGPWSLEGVAAIGQMLKELHLATASFRPLPDAIWQAWFGRTLGEEERVISHCDLGPWNIVMRQGVPFAFIDWEFAGPVDPLIALAQACWLNAKLHDDIVTEIEGLPPLDVRAQHLRAMVDAYGLTTAQRHNFIERIIDVVICDTAVQADDMAIGTQTIHFDGQPGNNPYWGIMWRARAGAWLVRHRRILQNALT